VFSRPSEPVVPSLGPPATSTVAPATGSVVVMSLTQTIVRVVEESA
jgi:hypothetical protein